MHPAIVSSSGLLLRPLTRGIKAAMLSTVTALMDEATQIGRLPRGLAAKTLWLFGVSQHWLFWQVGPGRAQHFERTPVLSCR